MFMEKGRSNVGQQQLLVSSSKKPVLNLIKLNHFKTRASALLKAGNYTAAYETYTMCIDMVLESSSSSLKRNKDETFNSYSILSIVTGR